MTALIQYTYFSPSQDRPTVTTSPKMAEPVDYGDPPVEPSPPVLEQIYTYWDMKSVRDFGCPADPDQRKQPPPKWPPEDGYGIDTFSGPRPAINPNMNRVYQRRRRAQRNHPSTLFEDVSKNRFKRALQLAKDSVVSST